MAEDDCIQYLGTRPAARALPSLPFLSSSQRPVTGLALYIEKSGTEPGHSLIFRKAEEPVVHIGRRPGSDGDKRKSEAGKAFFTCPVVSRHHAKIAFSDSGHCYIIDLHSHHGTHIRKRDDTVSKQINAETPTLLADGDVVTFGKSVGSDKGLVRPVVARVDLIYGSQPLIKPLVVPGTPEGQQKSLLRTPSGRYGVYVPSEASSSDERASSDSHDSSFYNVGFDAYSNDIFEDDDDNDDNSEDSSYSRSNSSMDLSSSPEPSDAPAGANKEGQAGEPVIVGAWPRSRSSSPVSVFSSAFPSVRIVAPIAESAPVKPAANDSAKLVDFVENDSDVEVAAVPKEDVEKSVDGVQAAQLEASLGDVKAEVAKLHAHRRKYKQRFNDNLHVVGDRFSDIEERTTEAHDLYILLSDRLEEHVDACHLAQHQLDTLQARMDETPDKAMEPEMPPYFEEAKAKAKVLEEMVTDMTTLRDNARKEMNEELQSIREAKEALKNLTEQVRAQTVSLKRKRLDEEAEGEVALKGTAEEAMAPPPPKRVRRVAKVVAQTAAAVSIGAVVTWSALAFS
ncbi:hypothetical protein B0H14DRAFT_1572084 [Mycena olivaceomarginata]|nr:hypothetical protein B0H14DRAFT_1572084 [Mycena olivaceomarginata]